MSDVTHILERIEKGDGNAAEELLPLIYEQLRHLAAARMAQEAVANTLQPTALVHEAWLRIAGNHNQHWNSRNHFFMAEAEAMRRSSLARTSVSCHSTDDNQYSCRLLAIKRDELRAPAEHERLEFGELEQRDGRRPDRRHK